MHYYIGVDQGKTHIRTGITNEEGELLYFCKRIYNCKSYEEISGFIISSIDEALEDKGIEISDIKGIGMGVPAVVERRTGKVLEVPYPTIYEGNSVTEMLSSQYNCPAVADVDTVVATYGEKWQGTGKVCDDFAVVTWGTGMGAGRVRNGEVVLGENNLFPEFGHWRVSDDDVQCNCGGTGCLNAIISGPGIAAEGQRVAEVNPESLLNELADSNGGKVTAHMVFEAAEEGDRAAQSQIERICELFGRMCTNLVYMDQPKKIVIVGGLSEQVSIPDKIQKIINEQCWLINKGLTECEIVFSQLQDTAGVLGAAYMAKISNPKG